MEEVHHLDKVLPNVKVKDINELNNAILACATIATQKFDS